MAKISYDTQVSTPMAANKKLLEAGIYTAMITRCEQTFKETGLSIKLTFGVLNSSQGITDLVPSYITFSAKGKPYAVTTCKTLMNCLGTPDIFDDEKGISQEDLKHILFKKIMINVIPGEGENKNGQKFPINKIEGYAPYGLAREQKCVSPKQIDPLPGTAHVNQTVPSTLDSSDIPSHVIEEDSFASIETY